MIDSLSLVAYVGPETIVPLTSLLAVIGGVALCGWQWVVGSWKRCWRVISGRRDETAGGNNT